MRSIGSRQAINADVAKLGRLLIARHGHPDRLQ
jgi:hypothetical protein